MKRGFGVTVAVCFVAASLAGSLGCRTHMPHHAFVWANTGDEVRTHPKPPEGGYYKNWDPFAASIELTPAEDTNPVRTQHMLIATVRDKDGKPLQNRRVEWIINAGSVGDIVEVDESGWRGSRGYKATNSFAVSHTNNFKHEWARGEGTPGMIEKGQTWCVITSPIEGNTYITAYCPAIFDWSKHKAFAVKHWRDIAIEYPPPATNPVGTTHQFVTKVMKASDGTPYANYQVTYKILSGPPAHFEPAGGVVTTDASGLGTVTLVQDAPAEGTNEIGIEVMRPGEDRCCRDPELIGTGRTAKTWVAPHIRISKNCVGAVAINDNFDYQIAVTNDSRTAATNVVLSDPLPSGVQYVSSNPPGSVSGNTISWNLGTVEAGQTVNATITVKAIAEGTHENCADVRADSNLSDRACCRTTVTAPALKLELVCDQAGLVCRELCSTVTVTNTGQAVARNIVINVKLPAGLMTTDGKSEMSFGAPSLEPGRSRQARFCTKTDRAGTYEIMANATADNVPAMDQRCAMSFSEVQLAVSKSAPGERYIGRPIKYDITVTNPGSTEARGVVLVDTPPSGMSLSSASDGGQVSGGRVTWQLGNMAPGASRTVSVNGTCNAAGDFKNSACATAECAQDCGESSVVVKGIAAILLEVVDNPDPVEVGTETTYTITVTNQGSTDGKNIIVECTLPAEEEFVNAGGATTASNSGKSVIFAALPNLAPKARASWTVTVRGVGQGDVRFKTTMKSDFMTGPPVEETESTHIYE